MIKINNAFPQSLSKTFLLMTSILVNSMVSNVASANPFTESHSFNAANIVAKEYIVAFTSTNTIMSTNQKLSTQYSVQSMAYQMESQYGAKMIQSFNSVNSALMQMTPKQMKKLRKDPRVQAVEKNITISVTPIRSSSNQTVTDWGLDRVDQHQLPLNNTYQFNFSGDGINAYVVDTGIDITNTDFKGRAHHAFNSIDNSSDSSDCNGHGTHVAGLIGSDTHGVAKGVTLHGVKVLTCNGSGTLSSVVSGIDWVIANAVHPAVANFSLGSGSSQILDLAIERLIDSGVNVAIAAGNSRADACGYSPKSPRAITVGSTMANDQRSSFSNFGSCVDIFAPGSNRLSTWLGTSANRSLSGTSMAAPTVAGAMALILEQYPTYSTGEVKSRLLARSTKDELSNLGANSPNQLVFTLPSAEEDQNNDDKDDNDNDNNDNGENDGNIPDDGDNITPAPCTEENCLKKDEPITVSGSHHSIKHFLINIPKDTNRIIIETTGGNGDVDLYARFGLQANINRYDCRPFKNGNNEKCVINNPEAGKWFVMLYGFRDYNNVSLKVSYTQATLLPNRCETTANCLSSNIPVNISGNSGSTKSFYVPVPKGTSELKIVLEQGSGTADILVKRGQIPSRADNDCAPFTSGTDEHCFFWQPAFDNWHITVKGWSDYDARLIATYQ